MRTSAKLSLGITGSLRTDGVSSTGGNSPEGGMKKSRLLLETGNLKRPDVGITPLEPNNDCRATVLRDRSGVSKCVGNSCFTLSGGLSVCCSGGRNGGTLRVTGAIGGGCK